MPCLGSEKKYNKKIKITISIALQRFIGQRKHLVGVIAAVFTERHYFAIDHPSDTLSVYSYVHRYVQVAEIHPANQINGLIYIPK